MLCNEKNLPRFGSSGQMMFCGLIDIIMVVLEKTLAYETPEGKQPNYISDFLPEYSSTLVVFQAKQRSSIPH